MHALLPVLLRGDGICDAPRRRLESVRSTTEDEDE